MKRKIFSQISLLLAIFTVVISLSACGTTKTTDTDNTYTGIDENSGLIHNLEATSTEVVPNVSTSTPTVQNISTSTPPQKLQGTSTSTPPQRPQGLATSTPPQKPRVATSTPVYNQSQTPTPRTSQS